MSDQPEAPQPEPVATVMLDVSRPHMAVDGKYVGQKADAKAALFFKDLPIGTPLYTSPPRREWVELTLDQISMAWDRAYRQPLSQAALNFARDIEQALKERNHE